MLKNEREYGWTNIFGVLIKPELHENQPGALWWQRHRGPGWSASAQTPEVSRGRGLTSVVPTPGGPLPDPTGGYSWQGVSVSDEARA